MKLATVVGKATGTVKANQLGGRTILIVDIVDAKGKVVESGEAVADQLGAGIGDWVLITKGSGARQGDTASIPIDATVVMILDEVTVGAKSLYNASASKAG